MLAMMKGDTPKANMALTVFQLSLICFGFSRKEARSEQRKASTHAALKACDMMVAHAAPFTPISKTKMNSGSSRIFRTAPIMTESIAMVGRPWVLMNELRPTAIWTNRVPNR